MAAMSRRLLLARRARAGAAGDVARPGRAHHPLRGAFRGRRADRHHRPHGGAAHGADPGPDHRRGQPPGRQRHHRLRGGGARAEGRADGAGRRHRRPAAERAAAAEPALQAGGLRACRAAVRRPALAHGQRRPAAARHRRLRRPRQGQPRPAALRDQRRRQRQPPLRHADGGGHGHRPGRRRLPRQRPLHRRPAGRRDRDQPRGADHHPGAHPRRQAAPARPVLRRAGAALPRGADLQGGRLPRAGGGLLDRLALPRRHPARAGGAAERGRQPGHGERADPGAAGQRGAARRSPGRRTCCGSRWRGTWRSGAGSSRKRGSPSTSASAR